jgi:hypothetical protein
MARGLSRMKPGPTAAAQRKAAPRGLDKAGVSMRFSRQIHSLHLI